MSNVIFSMETAGTRRYCHAFKIGSDVRIRYGIEGGAAGIVVENLTEEFAMILAETWCNGCTSEEMERMIYDT